MYEPGGTIMKVAKIVQKYYFFLTCMTLFLIVREAAESFEKSEICTKYAFFSEPDSRIFEVQSSGIYRL
jgi:hypothetical protein